ncbi:MAG: tetratricopeptide repeat protein, partial [Muribaculaceae bacterium]
MLSTIGTAAQPTVSAQADAAKAYDEAKRLSAEGALAKSVSVLSPIIEEMEQQAEASTSSNTLKAQILKLQGDNFMQIGLIDRTAEMYQRALKAFSPDSAPLLRADLQNAMFALYYRRNEYERARDIIDEAIAASRRANDFARLRRFTNNLGLAYAKSNMTDSALIAFNKAIAYSSASDDNLPIYINIADTHFNKGDLQA